MRVDTFAVITCLLLAFSFSLLTARLADPSSESKQRPCPLSCNCRFANARLTTISCQWQPQWTREWTEVTAFLKENPHPEEISIQGGLTEIPYFEENFDTVRLLKLVNNNLSRLHSQSFQALQYLVHLDVSFSNVSVMDAEAFRPLHQLQYLNLSHNNLSLPHVQAFHGLKNLLSLDISYNKISEIHREMFNGLLQLQYLNLSHNNLQTLPENVFHDFSLLKVLNLRSNRIESIPQKVFHVLINVEVIDLSSNRLSFLTSGHLQSLHQLKHLILAGNKFTMFHLDLMPVLRRIPLVDLSDNPFDCSCAVEALRNTIDDLALSSSRSAMFSTTLGPGYKYSSGWSAVFNTTLGPRYIYSSSHFDHLDKMRCRSPPSLLGISLTALDTGKLSCAIPTITNISSNQEVMVQGDVYLRCEAFGYPHPAIVWVTPWGEAFTHRKFYPLLGDIAAFTNDNWAIETVNIGRTDIIVHDNGTLHISRFRGILAGNFSCFAMGPSGNASSVTYVGITTSFRTIYLHSLLISLHCTAIALILGITTGFLRFVVCKIQQKLKERKLKELSKDIEETKSMTRNTETTNCNTSNSCHDSYDDSDHDHDDSFSGRQSLASPVSLTPEPTKKFPTPEDDISPTGLVWTAGNILETLDEVRSRLSLGVGRKMEKVRSQVQSFKESGTVYVQNIRTSSSVAANRVRAGVVLGVETIKYSAQSIREFCWNGDMSGQTISMVSVSTNVDTEKRTEVVHTVTFV